MGGSEPNRIPPRRSRGYPEKWIADWVPRRIFVESRDGETVGGSQNPLLIRPAIVGLRSLARFLEPFTRRTL